MNYYGEHLTTGFIGHYSLVATFLLAGLTFALTIPFIISNKSGTTIKKTVQYAFFIMLLLVTTSMAMLLINILSHHYEYSYVWEHSSNDLPVYYLISALWAGQDGSLLLWLFFILLIGNIVVKNEKEVRFEMIFLLSAFVFIFSFLLSGFSISETFSGNNPFSLLKDEAKNSGLAFFQEQGYAQQIADGRGLNPLLKNPWMVTHPPILFLGYALCIIPYSYTFAAILRKNRKQIIKKILPWTSTALLVLGTGLLLGGIWAYQELSFGGFWAWDPVENASLVPWLILAAALHLNLLLKKEHPVGTITFSFNLLAFSLTIFATFLTRSGVLQSSSVHSFSAASTNYFFMWVALGTFFIPMTLLLLNRKKLFPKVSVQSAGSDLTEHQVAISKVSGKKGFLIYFGSIVLGLSAFQIIFITSIPLYNAILGTDMAPPQNPENFYNNWQMIFASVFCLLIGLSQYYPYSGNTSKVNTFGILLCIAASAVSTIMAIILIIPAGIIESVYLFSVLFVIFSVLDSKLRNISTDKNKAAMIAHTGLGIFLFGILLTFSTKYKISAGEENPMHMNRGILASKGKIVPLSNSNYLSYSGSQTSGSYRYYQIDFLEKKDDNYYLKYSMFPRSENVQGMNTIFFPDIRNNIRFDEMVYLNYAEITNEGYASSDTITLKPGDSLQTNYGILKLQRISHNLKVSDSSYYINIMMDFYDGTSFDTTLNFDGIIAPYVSCAIPQTNYLIDITDADSGKSTMIIHQTRIDFVLITIIRYPFIWIIWFGALIAFLGIIYSIIRRFKK